MVASCFVVDLGGRTCPPWLAEAKGRLLEVTDDMFMVVLAETPMGGTAATLVKEMGQESYPP